MAGEPFLLCFLHTCATDPCQCWDPRPCGCQVSPAPWIQLFGESALVHKPLAEDKTTAMYEWTVMEGMALECLCGLHVKFFWFIHGYSKQVQIFASNTPLQKGSKFLILIKFIHSNRKILCGLGDLLIGSNNNWRANVQFPVGKQSTA